MDNAKVTLTQEELKEISEIQSRYQEITFQLGQAKLQLLNAQARETGLEGEVSALRVRENKLFRDLNEKYGPGTFNLQTGEFTPAETPAS